MIVLAGDIGGTNARLALYSATRGQSDEDGKWQLDPVFEHTYPSKSQPSLELIVEDFLNEARMQTGQAREITRACLGIAGPVENNICRATNLPWVVDGNALGSHVGIERVTLLNDFHAAALGVTVGRAVVPDRARRVAAGAARTDRGAGRRHRPRRGAAHLVAGREPLPGDPVRGRARRHGAAHAAGAGASITS